jgi:hypothetical protein
MQHRCIPILIKEKPCKGTGKCLGLGCGQMQKIRKYGLGTLCGCFYDWFNAQKTKPIKKLSQKRLNQNSEYLKLRMEFLSDNPKCFIEGCEKIGNTIEHTAGRGINYLNVETWKPCCLEHNLELENNPELSKKYQVSKIHGGKKMDK